ncbi:MAG: hypothetical protein KKH11_01670 [Candidatus Omnitrophica bacterium]|nr:hypothetical protein [Candidatus Omnitrophota bacterium]
MAKKKGKMAKKRSFALTEIIIVCVIISILGAVAVATYQRAAEKANQLLCETREKLIYTAVKMYIYDNNAVPASLSQPWLQYKDRAIAKLREENKKSSFSFVRNWALVKVAEAYDLAEYYGKDVTTITCPRDKTPPPHGVSYTINSALAGKSASFLKVNKDVSLIYESDSKGGARVYRHKIGRYAVSNYITAEGKLKKDITAWGLLKEPGEPATPSIMKPTPPAKVPSEAKGQFEEWREEREQQEEIEQQEEEIESLREEWREEREQQEEEIEEEREEEREAEPTKPKPPSFLERLRDFFKRLFNW